MLILAGNAFGQPAAGQNAGHHHDRSRQLAQKPKSSAKGSNSSASAAGSAPGYAARPPLYGNPSGKNMADGIAYFQKQEYKQSIACFNSAYQASEHPPLACFHQALAYHNLGDDKHTKELLEFLVRTFPQSHMVHSAQEMLKSLPSMAGRMIELPDDYQERMRIGQPGTVSPVAASSASSSANSGSSGRKGTSSSAASGSSSRQGASTASYTLSRSNHMILYAFINGKPIATMFDTGASLTMWTTSQLEAAGIKLQTHRGNTTLIGVGGESSVDEAEADVTVGGLTKRVTIYVHDDRSLQRNQGKSAGLDYGLIGQNFLGDTAYTVNDGARTITFHEPGFSLKGSDTVRYSVEGGEIIVLPKINGRECEMILDTGCNDISFSDKQLSAFGMSKAATSEASESIGFGGKRISYSFTIHSIKLGSVEKKDVSGSCDLHATISKPLLGRSFLSGLTFTVDPKAHLIKFGD